MKKQYYVLLICVTLLTGQRMMAQSQPDIQGHRGARGIMPENTMPAFLKAVEIGVNTLEMDVVISADKQIVISHEPWMSPVICSMPDGKPVTKKEKRATNIYMMNYADVQQYDCGLRPHPDFPSQQKLSAVKPTLKMVVRSVQRFAEENHYSEPAYNIELKSTPKGYDIFVPKPAVFVDLVVSEIRRLGIEDRVTLQSFDINVLEQLFKVSSRTYKISYLVEKGKNFKKNMAKLTFRPDIYSPRYTLIEENTVKEVHDLNMKIIPWTVNTKEEMKTMLALGVDGIISDYPDVAKSLTADSK